MPGRWSSHKQNSRYHTPAYIYVYVSDFVCSADNVDCSAAHFVVVVASGWLSRCFASSSSLICAFILLLCMSLAFILTRVVIVLSGVIYKRIIQESGKAAHLEIEKLNRRSGGFKTKKKKQHRAYTSPRSLMLSIWQTLLYLFSPHPYTTCHALRGEITSNAFLRLASSS